MAAIAQGAVADPPSSVTRDCERLPRPSVDYGVACRNASRGDVAPEVRALFGRLCYLRPLVDDYETQAALLKAQRAHLSSLQTQVDDIERRNTLVTMTIPASWSNWTSSRKLASLQSASALPGRHATPSAQNIIAKRLASEGITSAWWLIEQYAPAACEALTGDVQKQAFEAYLSTSQFLAAPGATGRASYCASVPAGAPATLSASQAVRDLAGIRAEIEGRKKDVAFMAQALCVDSDNDKPCFKMVDSNSCTACLSNDPEYYGAVLASVALVKDSAGLDEMAVRVESLRAQVSEKEDEMAVQHDAPASLQQAARLFLDKTNPIQDVLKTLEAPDELIESLAKLIGDDVSIVSTDVRCGEDLAVDLILASRAASFGSRTNQSAAAALAARQWSCQ